MTAGGLEARVRSAIAEAPLAAIDYAELRSYPSLEALLPGRKLSDFGQPMLLALAVKFGSTRLIDNAILH